MRNRQREAGTPEGKKTYRKMAKEVHKGMDRYIKPRGKTVGKNKLGVPIGKLPEAFNSREELIEKLEATLKAKIRNLKLYGVDKKPYSKNVQSKQALMSRIGKTTADKFGRKTLHLPGHRVFLTRFKDPKRLPENIGE
jgi:hypothetical protein